MVPFTLQLNALLGILFYFAIIFYLLNKKALMLKYTLMWIFSGIIMAVMVLFPSLLKKFSLLVGISTPSNALFAAILFFILLILMSLTSIISHLNEKNIKLIQSVAILEKRMRELENTQKTIVVKKSTFETELLDRSITKPHKAMHRR